MFRHFLRMRLLSPTRQGGMVRYLPQLARVFYRLMTDERVSLMAKAVPFLGLALMLTPPVLELDIVPFFDDLAGDFVAQNQTGRCCRPAAHHMLIRPTDVR